MSHAIPGCQKVLASKAFCTVWEALLPIDWNMIFMVMLYAQHFFTRFSSLLNEGTNTCSHALRTSDVPSFNEMQYCYFWLAYSLETR